MSWVDKISSSEVISTTTRYIHPPAAMDTAVNMMVVAVETNWKHKDTQDKDDLMTATCRAQILQAGDVLVTASWHWVWLTKVTKHTAN